MRDQVDQQFLPGVSTALLRGREVVDTFCYGHANKEANIALREDHIFRMFSNTKLVTSCAVMLLVEDGLVGLDDPIEAYIPELGAMQVLLPGAKHLGEVEPAKRSITVRHLMTHTSGLSYGIFDPGTVQFAAYNQAQVGSPSHSLADMMAIVGKLPLSFQPGSQWEYSVATDVLGRLVEVVGGESFGAVLQRRIFGPLGMVDTDFWVPESKRDRFCGLYIGQSLQDPSLPGLKPMQDRPAPGNYLQKAPRESGGGGLVSTLGDTVRLIQSLIPAHTDAPKVPRLLKPETIELMWRNHLPQGMCLQFPNVPIDTGRCFGLGSSITMRGNATLPAEVAGEVGWGGLAGTIWWINPRLQIAGVLMTQRYFGFGNPYAFAFKRAAYQALGF